jgi:hypothetical protein
MPSDVSAILSLPYLQPAQAQKHVTHNEALRQLDLLVQLAVASRQAAVPPADPAAGLRLIVPAGATGAFAGRDGAIALWDDGEWHFTTPLPGWRAEVLDEGCAVVFDGTAWRGPEVTAGRFASLGVAAEADATNRLAVAGPATLMTHAGAGHQLKINKATAGDTGSVVFQTGWSGRAEIGTTGSDDLAVRVSPDGTAWSDALVAEAASGMVRLPAGLRLPDGNALAPPLAFAADADTGLYRAGADALALAAGGVERVRVTSSGLEVTGTVTGTAVTQSANDTTAGRLTKVGDGGLLGMAVSLDGATDLKDRALPGGFYSFVGDVVPGGPENIAYRYSLIVLHGSVDGRRQFICWRDQGSGEPRVWFGQQATNDTGAINWSRAILHNNLLGPVSQSGGVPTGAVIERGSNANGEYTRFADGTLICTVTINLGPRNFSGSGTYNDPYRTNVANWTFPAAFAAVPVLQITPVVNGASGLERAHTGTAQSVSTTVVTSIQAVACAGVATGPTVLVTAHLVAIGRWF